MSPRTNDKIVGNEPEPRSGTTRIHIPTSLGFFKRISGSQAPSVNNCQNLPLDPANGNQPYVDLLPGDGIILRKQ